MMMNAHPRRHVSDAIAAVLKRHRNRSARDSTSDRPSQISNLHNAFGAFHRKPSTFARLKHAWEMIFSVEKDKT
jgi:hypothetical protein